MEVIRTIRTVKNGQVLLDLPSELSGRQVEIIVLTKDASKSKKKEFERSITKVCQT